MTALIPKVTIFRRKNEGFFYLRYLWEGKVKDVSCRTKDVSVANWLKRQFEDFLFQGRDPVAEFRVRKIREGERQITLRQYWTQYKKSHLPLLASKTQTIYTDNFKHLTEFILEVDRTRLSFVDLPMKDITKQNIKLYRELKLKMKLKPATINQDIRLLQTLLNKALEEDVLKFNPLAKLKPLRIPGKRYVTKVKPAQLAEFHSMLPKILRLICEFLAYTGRRLTEVLELDIEDVCRVDLPTSHWQAAFKTKGDRRQIFPLSDLAVEVFKEASAGRKSGPVFINEKTGTYYKSVHKTFDRWVERCGLTTDDGQKFNRHDYRRWLAQDAAARGKSMTEIQEALGHKSTGTTGLYTDSRTVPPGFFNGQKRLKKEE